MLRHLPVVLFALAAILCGGCEEAEHTASPAPVAEPEEELEAAIDESPRRPPLEKDSLILGVVPRLASTPVIVALAQGFFAEEGLAVSIQPFDSSVKLIDDLKKGAIDGGVVETAFFLADGEPSLIHNVYGMGVNQEAIGVSRALWDRIQDELLRHVDGEPVRPVGATALEHLAQDRVVEGRPLTFAVESRFASAHYLLRYWLAAAGLQPVDADDPAVPPEKAVRVTTMNIDEIAQRLGNAELDGFATGRILSQQLVLAHGGSVLASGEDVFADFRGQGFGMTTAWMRDHPAARQAVLNALLRAGQWLLASDENRRVAATQTVASLALEGDWNLEELGTVWADLQPSDFLPSLLSGTWVYTQMARWVQMDSGDSAEPDWSRVGDIFHPRYVQQSAQFLIDAQLAIDDRWLASAPTDATSNFIDGNLFDPQRPQVYLLPWTTKKPEA